MAQQTTKLLHSQQLDLGFAAADVQKLLQPWPNFQLLTDIDLSWRVHNKMHKNVWWALNNMVLLDWTRATQVHIFTDGSYLKRADLAKFGDDIDLDSSAAWSMVVIVEQITQDGATEFAFLGFMGEAFNTEENFGRIRWLGTEDVNALTAECAGVAWGTLWWLQAGIHVLGIPATLHVDCLAA